MLQGNVPGDNVKEFEFAGVLIEDAVELAKFEVPERFQKPVCELKGVYALEGELKDWLKKELGAG